MSVDQWAAVGIVCGAILTASGVVVLVGKGLGRLWEWRFGRDIRDTMDRIEKKLDQHLEWHAHPGGRPATGRLSQPNGPRHGPGRG